MSTLLGSLSNVSFALLNLSTLDIVLLFPDDSKTCPRRLAGGAEDVPQKPPRLSAAAALALNPLPHQQTPAALAPPPSLVAAPAAPVPLTPAPPPPAPVRPEHERIGALPLGAAITAARRRVMDAEALVSNASSAEEFETATKQLDASVLSLEKVVICARRAAAAIRSYNGV